VGDEGGVFLIIVILGPGVEFPVSDGDFACGIFYEDGAGIAGPSAIGGDAKKFHGGEIGAGIFQDTARDGFGVFSFDEDAHALDAREMTHDFGVDPWNGREFAGPVGAFVRPAEPGGFVWLPFGGHAIAEGVRRGARISGGSHSVRERITRIAIPARALRQTFAEPAFEDWLVGVNAAIAEEGPIAPGFFTERGIAFDDEDGFFVGGSFGENFAEGIGYERVAPEIQAGFGRSFEADAIDGRDVNAIGDGVCAMHCAPGVKLRGAELGFF
jgi:hypothetical protein